jgi:hypothetical protein
MNLILVKVSVRAIAFILAVAIGGEVANATLSHQLSEYEKKGPAEDQLIQGLISNISSRIDKKRDAHPKAHGCISDVKIEVLPNLGELQLGLFSEPGRVYKGIARLSSGSNNPKTDDLSPGGHGFALKIFLPEGDRQRVADIPGEQYFMDKSYYKTQDIITISGIHEFMVNGLEDYPDFFKAVGTADALVARAQAEGATNDELAQIRARTLDEMYFHLNGQEGKRRLPEALLMKALGSVQTRDVLSDSYQSWVPSIYGNKAVKYQIRPKNCEAQPSSVILPEASDSDGPDFLRRNLVLKLKEDACFELAVHVHEPGYPSIEDAALPWPRKDETSSYRAIAKITIPALSGEEGLMDQNFCESLSFNPGHSVPEHRGVGAIQRSRTLIYAAIETLRNQQVRTK